MTLVQHLDTMLHAMDGTRGLIASYYERVWQIKTQQGFDNPADSEHALQFLDKMKTQNSVLITITTTTNIPTESIVVPVNAFYSLMAVPVRDDNQLIGGIYIDRPHTQGDFTADDLTTIKNLSPSVKTYLNAP